MKRIISVSVILMSILALASCPTTSVDSGAVSPPFQAENTRVTNVSLMETAANQLSVSWYAPLQKEDIVYYVVEASDPEGRSIKLREAVPPGVSAVPKSKYTVTLPVPEGKYVVRVVPVRSGSGREIATLGSTVVKIDSKRRAPEQPTILSATAQATAADQAEITVKWEEVTDAGRGDRAAAVLETYYVYWAPTAVSDYIYYEGRAEVAIGETSYAIPNLAANTAYHVWVGALNSAGLEAVSQETRVDGITSQATAPGAVTVNNITTPATKTAAIIAFTVAAPTDTGLEHAGTPADIREYQVYWQQGSSVSIDSADGPMSIPADASGTTPVVIDGLAFTTEYTISIAAVNTGGLEGTAHTITESTGQASDAVKPGAVENLQAIASASATEITLSWDSPADPGKDAAGNDATITDNKERKKNNKLRF